MSSSSSSSNKTSQTVKFLLAIAYATAIVHLVSATDCATDAECGAGDACNLAAPDGSKNCFSCDTDGSSSSGYGTNSDGAGTPSCVTCTYESTATPNTYACTFCSANHFGASGSVSAITACAWNDDIASGGDYACDIAPGGFVDTTTETVQCTRTYSTGTIGAFTSVIDAETEVGWYAYGGETHPCNDVLPGCEVCASNKLVSVKNCKGSFNGWAWYTETAPRECTDPYCDDCPAWNVNAGCYSWVGGQVWNAYASSRMTYVLEITSHAEYLNQLSATVATIRCVESEDYWNRFPYYSTNGWCRPCNDSSFGVEGASECEFDPLTGVVFAIDCADGYAFAQTDGEYALGTCTYCGDGVLECDVTSDGIIANPDCDYDNGYAYVPSTDTCKLWLETDPHATDGSWNAAGTTFSASECEDAYYVSTIGECTACGDASQHIATCYYDVAASVVVIETCVDAYYYDERSNVCVACPQAHALECDASSVISCASGYYQSGANACSPNPAGFDACVDPVYPTAYAPPSYCAECEVGYGQNQYGMCFACADSGASDCVQISKTAQRATECKDGYYLLDGACVANPDGCRTVYQTNQFRTAIACQECEDGYYISWQTHLCAPCGTGIAKCSVVQKQVWPEECEDGYTWRAGTYDPLTTKLTFPQCQGTDGQDTGGVGTAQCAAGFVLAVDGFVVLALIAALLLL